MLGLDPGDRATGRALREQIGLVLQDIAVEPYLTVRETIARNAGYYPAPRDVDEVIGWSGWPGRSGPRSGTLSGGLKRRLDLALGLIGDPQLLFLDEPTTGFDPGARRDAWQIVRGLRDAGTTILLTTHSMDEAQALADRVAVIVRRPDRGRGPPRRPGRPGQRPDPDPFRAARRVHGRRPAVPAAVPADGAGHDADQRADRRRCTS